MARKLSSVHQDLALLAGQGKVDGFIKSVGNADRLGSLLEDIRDAMTEYQVRMLLSCSESLPRRLTFEPDFVATRYLRQKLSDHRESPTCESSLVLSTWRIGINGSCPARGDAPRRWGWIPLRK